MTPRAPSGARPFGVQRMELTHMELDGFLGVKSQCKTAVTLQAERIVIRVAHEHPGLVHGVARAARGYVQLRVIALGELGRLDAMAPFAQLLVAGTVQAVWVGAWDRHAVNCVHIVAIVAGSAFIEEMGRLEIAVNNIFVTRVAEFVGLVEWGVTGIDDMRATAPPVAHMLIAGAVAALALDPAVTAFQKRRLVRSAAAIVTCQARVRAHPLIATATRTQRKHGHNERNPSQSRCPWRSQY
jgi:hypothetical protein